MIKPTLHGLLVGILFLASSIPAAAAQSGFHPSDKVLALLGSDLSTLLADATSMEVFRLGQDPEKTPSEPGAVMFVGRPIVRGAPAPPADVLSRGLTAFCADATYFSQDSKGCIVGVGFRFHAPDGRTANIRCCMLKGNVLAEVTDASGSVLMKRDLKGFREDQAAPIRALAALLFPDDVDIQKYAPSTAALTEKPSLASDSSGSPALNAGEPPDPVAVVPVAPTFGMPGELIHTAVVALPHQKKSADRAEGGVNHVFFTLWIPEGAETVRGIYHTPFNLDTVEKQAVRAMAQTWGFAIVGGNLMRVRTQDYAPSLLTGLQYLAVKSGHAELNQAPLVFVSMSAGVGMCVSLAEQLPERTIACAMTCLAVGPESERTKDVPMMSIFGEKDGKQMEEHVALLPKRRAALDASWAITPQWGRRHEWGRANNLLWPFLDDIIRQRYPADASPAAGPVILRRYDPARVWFGDPASWGEGSATIAPASRYVGDKTAACWLPGEDVACVWQAFAVRKPLLRITTPEPQGDQKPLPVFSQAAEVLVQVQCDAAVTVERIALFDKSTRLAESMTKDGACEFRLTNLAPGLHVFIARATNANGSPELSRPVITVIQAVHK